MVAVAVRKCLFCGESYRVDKIADHEAVCAARPRRLSVKKAVEVVLRSEPATRTNRALLVRRVWELKDGYRSHDPAPVRLSDPWSIIRQAYALRKAEKVG